MKLILASKSPRRRELLGLMGLNFEVEVCDAPELVPSNASPEEIVCALGLQKTEAIVSNHPTDCVLGADTLVFFEGAPLGKPANAEEAKAFLRRLQGHSHRVLTGIALLHPAGRDIRVCETEVTLAPMTEAELEWYVSTGEPLDKAGAYGIQGPGGMFVSSVNGSYFNVMGMPIQILYNMLQGAGLWQQFSRI
jgi:septum formation protein